MEVLKNVSKAAHTTGYREVTIADEAGKTLGSHVRGIAKPIIELDSPATQFGSGLHSGACDIARLTVKTWPHIAQVKGSCLSIFFVDAKSAYASVIRTWIAPCPASSDE